MLIQNYGLFWSMDEILWDRRGKGNEGRLLGKPAKSKRQREVDFREQAGIYVLYADYEIVYVGQTGSKKGQKLFVRLRQHRSDALAGRWNKFSWFGTLKVKSDGSSLCQPKENVQAKHNVVLNQIEAILIHVSEPPLNRQGGKWSERVTQYIQCSDPRLGLSVSEMVEHIYKKDYEAKK